MTLSIAQMIANLAPEQRAAVLAGMSSAELDALATEWRFLAGRISYRRPGIGGSGCIWPAEARGRRARRRSM
jgi:hypothetical protein